MTSVDKTSGSDPAARAAAGGAWRRRGVELGLLLVPMLLLVVLAFDLPILNTALWSVFDPDTGALTLRHFREFFQSNAYMRIIWRTLVLSFQVTVATVLLGYPLAYWATRLSSR